MKFIYLSLLLSANAMATDFNGYIVKMKNNNSLNAFTKSSAKIIKTVETDFGVFSKVTLKAENGLVGLNLLNSDPNIEYVEPNWIIKLENNIVSTEPSIKKQWGLNNEGLSGGLKGEDINAYKAWDITTGKKEIKVAVIDTGVDYNHPDLKNQIDINVIEQNGKPGIDDDGNGFVDDIYGYNFATKTNDPMDGNSHGTHCAGVIGAEHNNLGIAGVMANVKIIPVKFLSDSGSGEEIDAVAAIDYAIKRGAKVLSNSWGGAEKSQALEDAIKIAEEKGIVFVAAAGNEYANNDTTDSYPANIKLTNVISVGAFTAKGNKASFSNYGTTTVHVFAPGQDIYSTVPNGKYSSMSGTSMATPFVSGIIGLMLSKNPNLTPEEIRNILIDTSVNNKKLDIYSVSKGRVDAFRALTAIP